MMPNGQIKQSDAMIILQQWTDKVDPLTPAP